MKVRVLGGYNRIGQVPGQYVPQRMLAEDWQKNLGAARTTSVSSKEDAIPLTQKQKEALIAHMAGQLSWGRIIAILGVTSIGGAVLYFGTSRLLKYIFPEKKGQ